MAQDSSCPKREPQDTLEPHHTQWILAKGSASLSWNPGLFFKQQRRLSWIGAHRVSLVSLIPLGNSAKTLFMTKTGRYHQRDRYPYSLEKYHSSIVITKRPTPLPHPREPSYRMLTGRQERPGGLVGMQRGRDRWDVVS